MRHAEISDPTAGADGGREGAYLVRDAELIMPTSVAQGPWGGAISGHVLGGLLGATLERVAGDTAFQPARLTVDLLRPAMMEPVEVDADLVREGGRIRLADATLTQRGKLVGRASAVFLRRGDHPAQQVWSPEVTMPPPPVPMPPSEGSPFALQASGWGADAQSREASVPKFAWLRETRPLIEGELLSPFARAAMAGDVTSTVMHWGTAGMRFINIDCTVTLSRLPETELVGIAAQSHLGQDGVATGVATLFDTIGPIGHAMATALADSRFRSPFPRSAGPTTAFRARAGTCGRGTVEQDVQQGVGDLPWHIRTTRLVPVSDPVRGASDEVAK